MPFIPRAAFPRNFIIKITSHINNNLLLLNLSNTKLPFWKTAFVMFASIQTFYTIIITIINNSKNINIATMTDE